MPIETPTLTVASADWAEHALLDSGKGRKLERFGKMVLIRPEPKAWWTPALKASDWAKADAEFLEDGRWKLRDSSAPRSWNLRWGKVTCQARLTDNSKHLGVFPEQDPHWQWLYKRISGMTARAEKPRVLNLFGYTGMASLIAASAGAAVTHVDASKPSVSWGRYNQELSGMSAAPIRWILDDAFKYVQREIRRGSRYEGICLDPPSFGRGPRGEVWKVEEQLSELLDLCRQLLSEQPSFVLLTLYNLEASALMARNLMASVLSRQGGSVTCGELALRPDSPANLNYLPLSLWARWECS